VSGGELFKGPFPDPGNLGTYCGTKELHFIIVTIINLRALSGKYPISLNTSRNGRVASM
jgi:hypothetical protein